MKKIILIFLIFTLTISSFFSLNVFAASDKTNAKNATTISLNKKKTDTTTISGKFYKFDIKQPGKLTLKLDFEDGNIPAMILYDFDDDTFDEIASASASSGWVGINEEDPIYIENLRLTTGTYYVKVYWGAGTAFFVDDLEHYLTAIFETENEGYEKEDNNKASNANTFSNKIIGNIGTSSDVDFYVFTPPSNMNIKVRFSLDQGYGSNWKTTLYELNGNELIKLDYISLGWLNSKNKLTEDVYSGRYYAMTKSISIQAGKKYYVCVECDNGWYHSDKDYTIEIIDESGNLLDNNGNNGYGGSSTTTSFGSETSIWAKDEVEKAYKEGLVPETLVGKDLTQKINRSEFAAVAVLVYENLTDQSVSASSAPFIDINSDPNKKAINKAYKLGITVGTSSTTFDPTRNITREELATMFCRAIKKYKFPDWTFNTDYMYYMQGTSGKKFADDAEISDYAKDSVYAMSTAGIIKGVDSTHFAPKASVIRGEAYGMATREQAIIMAKRIKENKSYFDDI